MALPLTSREPEPKRERATAPQQSALVSAAYAWPVALMKAKPGRYEKSN